MKIFFALVCISMFTIVNAQPPGTGWTMVFSDEFDGTSLDTDKWKYNTSTSEFSTSNVIVADDILKIVNIYTEGSVATGGWINSKNAGFVGDNKFGYYEAKIRINGAAHGQIWPTWWIWGGNWRDGGPAPTTTEFDLMEYSGHAAEHSNNHATTSHHYKGKIEIDGQTHVGSSKESNATRNAFEWHVWGLLWSPTEVSFWYDGVKYLTSPQPGDAAAEDIEMNLIFSSSPHIKNNPNPANLPVPGETLPSFEIDWVRVHQGGTVPSGQAPYGGTARTIPGTIEVEEYDEGGEGVAYHDTEGVNNGDASMRTDQSVDIENRDGGQIVGWTENGEWLEYTVNTAASTYDIEARVAAITSGKSIIVQLDGEMLDTLSVPNTGNWGVFQNIKVSDIDITEGTDRILRLKFLGGGVNINWVKFESVGDTTSTDTTSASLELFKDDLEVFPNVVNEEFQINFNKSLGSNSQMNLYNNVGYLLRTEILRENSQTFSIADLPSGIYLVQIVHNGKSYIQKIIKSN